MANDTLDDILTGLATIYGGPTAGLIVRGGLKLFEARAGRRLQGPKALTKAEALAVLDGIDIGVTADEQAAGAAAAEVGNEGGDDGA